MCLPGRGSGGKIAAGIIPKSFGGSRCADFALRELHYMAKKLTIIVGAGASKELGLPIGCELKQKIAKLLDIRFDFRDQKSGDHYICSALRLVAHQYALPDINPFLQAAWMIRDAMPQAISIDNFIDSHQGNEEIELCGKLAIVRSILDTEKQSKMFVDYNSGKSSINYTNTEDCWLTPFVRLVTENCRVDELKARLDSITFVIFNYDRCIEHYLYYALQNYYKIRSEERRVGKECKYK